MCCGRMKREGDVAGIIQSHGGERRRGQVRGRRGMDGTRRDSKSIGEVVRDVWSMSGEMKMSGMQTQPSTRVHDVHAHLTHPRPFQTANKRGFRDGRSRFVRRRNPYSTNRARNRSPLDLVPTAMPSWHAEKMHLGMTLKRRGKRRSTTTRRTTSATD